MRFVHVANVIGNRQHNNGQSVKSRLVTNPSQHFKTGESRQPQIQQHEERHGIKRAVCVSVHPGQIFDGFLAVFYHVQRISYTCFAERAFEQHDIFRIVLDHQYSVFQPDTHECVLLRVTLFVKAAA